MVTMLSLSYLIATFIASLMIITTLKVYFKFITYIVDRDYVYFINIAGQVKKKIPRYNNVFSSYISHVSFNGIPICRLKYIKVETYINNNYFEEEYRCSGLSCKKLEDLVHVIRNYEILENKNSSYQAPKIEENVLKNTYTAGISKKRNNSTITFLIILFSILLMVFLIVLLIDQDVDSILRLVCSLLSILGLVISITLHYLIKYYIKCKSPKTINVYSNYIEIDGNKFICKNIDMLRMVYYKENLYSDGINRISIYSNNKKQKYYLPDFDNVVSNLENDFVSVLGREKVRIIEKN